MTLKRLNTSLALITSISLTALTIIVPTIKALALDNDLLDKPLVPPTPDVESHSVFSADGLDKELAQSPTLFMAYHSNLNDGTARAAVKQLQSLQQANTMAISINYPTQEVSINTDQGAVLTLKAKPETMTQAAQALEKTRLSLKDYIASGGKLEEIKPTQLPNKVFGIKAGNNVLLTLEDLGIGYTLENYIEQRSQVYDMTNSIRKAYGLDPILMKAIEDPSQSKADIEGDTIANFVYRGTGKRDSGMASWYGPGFHGRRCANGERFDMNAKTAAHKKLAFGTMVKVTNKRNGKSVVVRITDRGPYAHGRIIDLSKGAASVIGLTNSGVAPVEIEVLKKG